MSDGSGVLLFLRVGTSLAIVLGLIWVAARVARRRIRPGSPDGVAIGVVSRRSLGRRTSLVVVDAGGRSLLVGVTDHQVNLVADVTPVPGSGTTDESAPAVADGTVDDTADALDLRVEPADARSGSLVETLRELTVRRA